MATKTFQDYFTERPLAIDQQGVEGDQLLILRGGTVFQANFALNTAYAFMADNASETTINTIDVWELIAGTFVEGSSSATFTFAANAFTYIGPTQNAASFISASFSIFKSGAGFETYQVGVFVNGLLVGNPMSVACGDDEATFVLTNIQHALTLNDVIDMRIRCTTDNDNVTVTDAQLVL